jgi:hypothetical protein
LQEELETHDGVSKGKYTIGLGQDSMAFCTEVEDVISMRYDYFLKYLLLSYLFSLFSSGLALILFDTSVLPSTNYW